MLCAVIGFLVVVGTLLDMFGYQDAKDSGIAGKEIFTPPVNSDQHPLLSADSQGSQTPLKHRVLHNGMSKYVTGDSVSCSMSTMFYTMIHLYM